MSLTVVVGELAEFLESGVSVLVGTRDAALLPAATRGMGLRVEPGGGEVTVFLPEATSTTALEHLADNGRIALTVSRPGDHRSVQIKGRVVEIRPGDAADRERIERYRGQLAASWAAIGIPPHGTRRLVHWPCHAVRFRLESSFAQTPGPGAGLALGAAAAGGGA